MAIWMRGTVDDREAMVLQWLSGQYTAGEVAARFETSRTTLYQWTARYRAAGRAGLQNRPPVAATCPHKTAEAIEAQIVAVRRRYGWGPKKLRVTLQARDARIVWPAASTIGDILARHGLLERRPRRRTPGTPFRRKVEPVAAGDLMTVDFKGQFKTGDGAYCYPLTMMERTSRYLLACEALRSTAYRGVWPIFVRVFQEYGVPRAMLSDNGSPFVAPRALARVTRLSVHLMQLGIQPVITDPGHPEQNGAHERMHATLAKATTRPPGRHRADQQRRFDAFRTEYNHDRPHEALGQTPPAAHFRHTTRQYPAQPPAPDYPRHYEVRRISSSGTMKFNGVRWFVGDALAGELVGLEPIDDGVWSLQFYRFELARLNERDRTWA
jgi:transposase InsO family protein